MGVCRLVCCLTVLTTVDGLEPPFVEGIGLGDLMPEYIMDAFKKVAALNSQEHVADQMAMTYQELKASLECDARRLEQEYKSEEIPDLKRMYWDLYLEIEDNITSLTRDIAHLKGGHMLAKMANIKEARPHIEVLATGVQEEPTPVVNFGNSLITKMETAVESVRLNVQYFSFVGDETDQKSAQQSLETHVKAEFAGWGAKAAAKASASASNQHSTQTKKGTIQTVVVYTAHATHANARMLEPVKFDSDKLCNAVLQKSGLQEKLTAWENFELLQKANASIKVITGLASASTMIGMVHYVKKDTLKTKQGVVSEATKAKVAGGYSGFGFTAEVGAGAASDAQARNAASQSDSQLMSDAYLFAMGALPTIKSNPVEQMTKILNTDPEKEMQLLLKAREADDGQASIGKQMLNMQGKKVENLMVGVTEGTRQENQVIDANTLMTALDNFLELVKNPNTLGAPIKFYVTEISPAKAAQLYYEAHEDDIINGRKNQNDEPEPDQGL